MGILIRIYAISGRILVNFYAGRSLAGPSLGVKKLAPSKRRMCTGRQAGRRVSVSFPDDVHVVVIIIIAFCIITIISAATSVIYSRSRVCIMRAGVLRLRALITTLPVYSSVSSPKTAPTIIIAVVEGRRSRRPNT